jgi:hypothetical protein
MARRVKSTVKPSVTEVLQTGVGIKYLGSHFKLPPEKIRFCLRKVATESNVSTSVVEDAVTWHFIITPLLAGSIERFNLTSAESDILKSYLEHIHPESKVQFIHKVFRSDRSYIDKFLATEFEEFGESVFGEEEEEGEEQHHHKDLYETRQDDDATKYLLIYQAVLNKLRQLPAPKRDAAMRNVFGFHSTSKDKLKRRKLFYTRYKAYISTMTQPGFEALVDDVFSKTVNPFERESSLGSPRVE